MGSRKQFPLSMHIKLKILLLTQRIKKLIIKGNLVMLKTSSTMISLNIAILLKFATENGVLLVAHN